LSISSPSIDRFSKFFHCCWNVNKTVNKCCSLMNFHGLLIYGSATEEYTLWAIKNVALYFCPYLCQLLGNFQNSFTGTLCRQFTIMWLLYIPPHCKCVSTLPCEISMKCAYIMIITNILVKLKKTPQTNITVNDLYDTRLCGYNTV